MAARPRRFSNRSEGNKAARAATKALQSSSERRPPSFSPGRFNPDERALKILVRKTSVVSSNSLVWKIQLGAISPQALQENDQSECEATHREATFEQLRNSFLRQTILSSRVFRNQWSAILQASKQRSSSLHLVMVPQTRHTEQLLPQLSTSMYIIFHIYSILKRT